MSTILVVEDDPNSAIMLTDLLTAHGHLVFCEATGSGAIKRLEEETVDLAVLDLRLPQQNGFMLAEWIRQTPKAARMPIIVISAYTDRQNRLRAYQSGVNVVLGKPVDTAELVLLLGNLLLVTGDDAD